MQICTEKDDVLLTAGGGQCIRFAVPDVRVFQGRTSMGVRGISLGGERQGHLDVDPAPCRGDRRRSASAYLQARQRGAPRRRRGEETGGRRCRGERPAQIELGEKRYVEMSAAEQFVLTLSEKGLRQAHVVLRIPHHRPRRQRHRRHGHRRRRRTASIVASFPVEEADQIMLVTDGGKLIRTPVDGIRIAGRSTQGVIVFDTADDESVVSVERLSEERRGISRRRIDRARYPRHYDELVLRVRWQFRASGDHHRSLVASRPGPIVTLVIATGASAWRARGADHRSPARRIGNALLIAAIALGPELACSTNAAGLFEVLRWVGVAYLVWLGIQAWRSAGQTASKTPPRARVHFWRGMCVALTNPEDHRVLHGVPAAIRRSVLAGGASIIRHVRDVYSDRLDLRFRLGHRIGTRARLVHEAVARQIARPHVRRGADRRRHLVVAGAPSGLIFSVFILGRTPWKPTTLPN